MLFRSQLFDDSGVLGWVAGAVREHYSVRSLGDYFLSRGVRGHDDDFAAALHKLAPDVCLSAEVPEHDAAGGILGGYVVNKVGTLQIAICANHFGIPTFVTGAPDIGHETKDTVKIEMRDPEFTLQAMGVRTAAQGVKGYYPAFDMTPPHLISGIVTDRGVFSPFDLHRYFAGGGAGEYDTVV